MLSFSLILFYPCPAELFFFLHLRIELLKPFPDLNEEKYYYLWKINIFISEVFY